MQLHALLRLLDAQIRLADIPNVTITGVCEDSRNVTAGNLFVATPGGPNRAVRNLSRMRSSPGGGDCDRIGDRRMCAASRLSLPTRRTRRHRSQISITADRAAQCRCLAITGTNGKTTTTYLLRHLLAERASARCGLMGTVEIDDGRNAHARRK